MTIHNNAGAWCPCGRKLEYERLPDANEERAVCCGVFYRE